MQDTGERVGPNYSAYVCFMTALSVKALSIKFC